VERFASGWKRNYYGKGDVVAYRLRRGGERPGVFGANVTLLVYGDAFWPTYTTGDNTGLVATDSMKNFIQRETLSFAGDTLEPYVHELGTKFIAKYPQVEGAQVSAVELPYAAMSGGTGYVPGGPERATARVELTRDGIIDLVSGLRGFRLLRLTGSAFHGFVRDEYTTLPDLFDRPLHMWLDLEWRYIDPQRALTANDTAARAGAIVYDVFERFESGSIQQVIYSIGTRLLEDIPAIGVVDLEANNRTWDTVAEQETIGVYTDPRPPFGCLGLRLTR
jgi:urate oxidase / 2-oxo-4-hydroxy-4-carboxy-5-ureidoimidazoline decarboxylase